MTWDDFMRLHSPEKWTIVGYRAFSVRPGVDEVTLTLERVTAEKGDKDAV